MPNRRQPEPTVLPVHFEDRSGAEFERLCFAYLLRVFEMSAFNVLTVEQACPSCKNQVSVRIQFKYGNTWQDEYRLGDRIRWGGNATGTPGRRRVVLDGAGERCPHCGYSDWDFYVFLQNDVLSSVKAASGEFDFVRSGGEPIILQE